MGPNRENEDIRGDCLRFQGKRQITPNCILTDRVVGLAVKSSLCGQFEGEADIAGETSRNAGKG
jgi:hypothetical protein